MVPDSGAKGVRFSRRNAERALEVVERWKGQIDGEAGSGTSETVMFLQMVPSLAIRFSASYNYPSQTIYDGSNANPYATTYVTSHFQTPAGLQQHYLVLVDNLASSGYPSTSSYANGQTSYDDMYDYGNAAPPTYQNQTSYMG
ncbi:unnamed protein product [Lupinus luteus]|uniref:Uncharacterized protein n=1 Tax=Lupinus luteus TaxID=3873 RepID=A0AAV1YAL5_LUPLU